MTYIDFVFAVANADIIQECGFIQVHQGTCRKRQQSQIMVDISPVQVGTAVLSVAMDTLKVRSMKWEEKGTHSCPLHVCVDHPPLGTPG